MRKETNHLKNKGKEKEKKTPWSVRSDRRKKMPIKLPATCSSSK